ncbi:response regulator transcription factor [Paenibacillus hamazuiensis]|uniref:response regulator transcription factor n=1 Tax=Paenibacillus hamazuiensis TaxID=2936508 RepID=UPI00200D4347|nr:response regulator [Paenibacillus hamazuiensis]
MSQLLIVDDEAHVVERLATLVPWEQTGITGVHKAFSAYEALEVLASQPIDLVLTDIRMPGMSGLELAGRIRSGWPKTKCILLSGHAEFEYAKEAIAQGTADYLLKPVTDSELLGTVSRVLRELHEEWERVISQERIARTLRENLPQLRGNLLAELLQGRRFTGERLREQMELLEVPRFYGEPFAMVLLRLEEPFHRHNPRGLALLEYAIGNMAEELFAPQFEIWHGKDVHDYLIFLVKENGQPDGGMLFHLERPAAKLQEAVRTYLKGAVSIAISRRGTFPADLDALYGELLSALRRQIGPESELILTAEGQAETRAEVRSLESLYELPTLAQLLEASRWEAIGERCERIFRELKERWGESQEHLLEVFLAVSSAAAHYAHKNGRQLAELIGPGYEKLLQGVPYRSVQQLHDWTNEVLGSLRLDVEGEVKHSRAQLIAEVQQYVERHLADASLNAIAEHVYMHPVYVSKIYKLETGENLSDYVYRVRMEHAAHLLLSSQEKIYEIAAKLGYQRAHSFINVFKKHTGLTPQEYRDKHLSSK